MAKKFKPDFNLNFNLLGEDEKSDVDIALEGLLSDTSKQYKSNDIVFNVKNIKYEDIEENEYDKFSKEHVEFLMESIRNEGLKEPITVYKKNKKYIILSGHSRFQAITRIKKEDDSQFESIPCNIIEHEFTDVVDEKKALAEYNQVREKNNRDRFLEYNTYVDFYDKHEQELKEKNIQKRDYISFNMGISKDMVSRYSTIEKKCIEELKSIMLDGYISMKLTRKLCKLTSAQQEEILKKANENLHSNNDSIENIGDYLYELYVNFGKKKSEKQVMQEESSTLQDIHDTNLNKEIFIDNIESEEELNENNYLDDELNENMVSEEELNNLILQDLNEESLNENDLNEEDFSELSDDIINDIDNDIKEEEIIDNSKENLEDNDYITFSVKELKPHIPLVFAENLEKMREYIIDLIIKAEDNI